MFYLLIFFPPFEYSEKGDHNLKVIHYKNHLKKETCAEDDVKVHLAHSGESSNIYTWIITIL